MATRENTTSETATTENELDVQALAGLDFSPIFTLEAVEAQEAAYNETWGARRRLMLATLCRSRDSLVEGFGAESNGAVLALDLEKDIAEYRDHLKAGIELAEATSARLTAVVAALYSRNA